MRHALLAAAVLLAPAVQAAMYEIDPDHSQVGFKIRHLVSKVPGHFKKFSGVISYEPGKPESWKVEAKIDPASIDTANERRDNHLRAPDFFDVAKCPDMSFKSTKVTDAAANSAKVHGDLTMHCVTKPVVLDLEIGGTGKDPWGNERAGFTARGKVMRKDFNISWNKALDNGGVLLGEDVDVTIEIEATLAKAAPKADAKPKK